MKTLYIWGTGNDATRLTREYPILAIYARNFVDSAKDAKDMFFKGKRVVSPDCIIWDNCFVIIATRKYFIEISGYLDRKGLKREVDYCGYENAYYRWMYAFQDSESIKKKIILEENLRVESLYH